MQKKRDSAGDVTGLRGRAESSLRNRTKAQVEVDRRLSSETQRLLHELQVHQVELEMQNAELVETRDRTDMLLEKFTDLYDFAPVGFFTLDDQGRILEVNLTGSVLLGVERSKLISRFFSRFVLLPGRSVFLGFLARVFSGTGKESCEAKLSKEDGTPFWASLNGCSAVPLAGQKKACRVAVSDITSFKQAQEAQRLLETLSVSNEALKKEIVRRQTVEEALKDSEQHQRQLLEHSRRMQEQLRDLSHRVLQAREDERKRISRELHDEVTQTLVGINVHLETLSRDATISPKRLRQKVLRTQRLVEKAVETVHEFARELRPTSLDDLGLIVTLHSFLNDFMKRTGIRVHFTAFAAADQLDGDQRTTLFRVLQEALANVSQHAHASRVQINIHKSADVVHMEISDNGDSFDVARTLDSKKNKRLGLIGMRERVEMIGGQCTITSAPGEGTRVHAQIPFKNGNKEHTRP